MRLRFIPWLIAPAVLGACDPGAPLIPSSDEPLVMAVLAVDGSAVTGTQSAIVLSAGTPLQPRYRSVDRFDMRRAGDGALFAWQAVPRTGDPPASFFGLSLGGAENAILPPSGTAGRLGAADIESGQRYTLEIDTDGAIVRGTVLIPSSPAPRLEVVAGRRVVVWPKAFGAAGYLVRADTDISPAISRPLSDTTYVLREDSDPATRPPNPKATIIALDSSLFSYLADTTVRSAGLTGALGVFGAFARTVLPLQ